MTTALEILAGGLLLLTGGLVFALVDQQARHNRYTAQLIEAFRIERGQLLNKIDPTGPRIPDGSTIPRSKARRSPETERAYAGVGTVAPPRATGPGPNGDVVVPDEA